MITISSPLIHDIFLYNVGHGDCALVKDETHALLVDCGAVKPSLHLDVPLMIEKTLGGRIECALALSHYHWDHYSLFPHFTNPDRLFTNVYVPALPISGLQGYAGLAVMHFLSLASMVNLQFYRVLPEVFSKMRKLPIALQLGDSINEAHLHFEVRWPDLSSPLLQRPSIINRSKRVLSYLVPFAREFSLDLPQKPTEDYSTERFFNQLREIISSEFSESEAFQIKKALRHVEEEFRSVSNVFSLAFESFEKEKDRFLFLGDLTSLEINALKRQSNDYDACKAAHHATEFGSNLTNVSTKFVLVSRNQKEFRKVKNIHRGYFQYMRGSMILLSTEFLGSCHLNP